ncbi:MAG TPA: hypothetical protein VNA20_17300 [Frankiaceae bacterium]|nr:hypothetical protein [Frankiaceae bacterium]
MASRARVAAGIAVVVVTALAPAPADAYSMRLEGSGCATYDRLNLTPQPYWNQELNGNITAWVEDDPGANLVTVTLRCTYRWDRSGLITHRSQPIWGAEATGAPTAVLITGVAAAPPAARGSASTSSFPTSTWCIEVETTDARGVHRHVYGDGMNGGWTTDGGAYCQYYS